jgi:hypothetical protein
MLAKGERRTGFSLRFRRKERMAPITSRPKRPLKSIILDTGVKEAILEDALDFLDSKEWYSERGIPFRRGYLLVSHIYIWVPITSLLLISFYGLFLFWYFS